MGVDRARIVCSVSAAMGRAAVASVRGDLSEVLPGACVRLKAT